MDRIHPPIHTHPHTHTLTLTHSQARAAVLYSESIEKLHQVLAAMQNMSQKRERLEKRLRSQLSAEIRELRGEKGAGPEGEGAGTEDCQLQSRVVTLEADVAKVGYSC